MLGSGLGQTGKHFVLMVSIILFLSISAGFAIADHIEVTNDRAVLRAGASSASERVRGLATGERLNLRPAEAAGGNWLPVFDPDTSRDAWVYRSFVRLHEGDVPGDAPPVPTPVPTTPPGGGVPGADLPGLPRAFYLIEESFYTAGFDPRLKIPVWTQYRLRGADLDGPAERGGLNFTARKGVPERFQADNADYSGNEYEKGHMAPAEDMTRSDVAMKETFYYTNAAPQLGNKYNKSKWKSLEIKTREWARARGELIVVMGPVFELAPPDEPTDSNNAAEDGWVKYKTMGTSRVAVPHAFFRVVYDPVRLDALAFLMPHRDVRGSQNPVRNFVVTIDDIEERARIDLFPELPDAFEDMLEAKRATELWAGVDSDGNDIDSIVVPID